MLTGELRHRRSVTRRSTWSPDGEVRLALVRVDGEDCRRTYGPAGTGVMHPRW
jgi:hypothetical protein